MATLAELWDEPAAKPKAAASNDVAPKRNALSTYKPGTPFGEPEQPKTGATMADLWDTTPASTSTKTPEKTGESKGVVASALEAAFKARDLFRGSVAEPIATLATGAQAAPIGTLTGLVAAARSGKFGTQEGVRAAEEQAKNYAQQTTYQPRTETGKAVVGAIGRAAEKLAGAGPLPELYAFAPLAEGAARQAVTGAKAMKAELPTVRIENVAKAAPEMPAPTAGSVGAAKVEFNPYAGQITGEEAARGQFPQIKLSKMTEDAPATEQSTRAQIAQEILREGGVDTDQVRQGVITGNENTLRNEHAKAKMANPTPEGELYKQQIANEQNALSNFALKRVENTGASPTLVTPYERGERINSAFAGDEGLTGFFKGEKNKLYETAKQTVGDNPVQSSTIESLINSPQFKAELKIRKQADFTGGLKDLLDLHSTQGLEGTAPGSIAGLEKLRQSLNAQWTPENAYAIRKAVEAIDSDIAKAGGPGLYEQARSLHQAEKVLFGSKGIKQIFGDIDPNGVQTATAFEKIPEKLNSMPVDQWKHIYETAEKIAKGTVNGSIDSATGMPKWTVQVPEELRVSAQSALNEMKGNIAREIYQAGATKAGEWNQNAVNKVLNARADKIKLAFSPEEQKAFHTLNVGGYLMPGVHSYEGGGQQLRRVGLIEGNLGKAGAAGGAAAGTALLGPGVGTAVGGYLGGKAGVAGSEALAARALQKQAKQSKAEMQKAAKLGSKLSDIGKEK